MTIADDAAGRLPPDFPTEVTFKAVFRSSPFTRDTIRSLVLEHNVDPEISQRESREGRFVSITVTAVFPSEKVLQAVCANIAALDGFVTMF
ncbi:MAG TPA: DUF493 family protein [Spirochaetota bacterium]|nr:DUF493 family protein [Spirochaetota bacterium]HNT12711.1 DUF493 family protein [Spirochaetota bacterium]HOS38158.1 DUF493 family protein [Spirochaetota bacterium]